jgi:hypothetical protein
MNSTSAWTTWVALTLGAGCSSPDAGAGPEAVGSGGAGTTSAAATSTTSAGTGGPDLPYDCDPAAEPGSLYELAAVSYDIDTIDPVSMCEYRGDVMLIVNTAAL